MPSVFTVAIGTQPEVMQNAAIRLLGLNTSQVKKQAEDIIFGQLRQVIASMQIEDINRDRELFLTQIQSSLEPELKKIGLVLINVNITDITDESGYIEAIGRKAASEAVQKARGDVADQVKLGEVRVAQAEREKKVEVANAQKLQHIGIREADREQAVRIAELAKEQEVGEKEALFLQEMAVAEAAQKKRVAVADANATALVGEKEAELKQEVQIADADQKKRVSVAELNAVAIAGEAESAAKVAQAKAELQFKQAEAYQLGETKKRESEAAVQEAQNRAMAQAALADAERVEAERRAELEAPAKAEKAKRIVEAEAEAARIRLEAEGEAAAIFSKLQAQAKGEYEILAAKGKGLETIITACGGAEPAFRMMMLEHMDNLAESSAKAISNIKFDKVVVWENGGKDGQSSTAGFLQGLSRSMPPMMHVMKDIAGVEMPEYLAKLSGEENGVPAKPGNRFNSKVKKDTSAKQEAVVSAEASPEKPKQTA